ncbi:hypothetical protein TIFTF001_023921 [Ficus carica]|uniref:Uncharacterized protein n=1 Tax=Ficus carica TaxID=3494 RepID=A0AA88DE96_FICCA|nr:hypothetical protein TIFTF001_023921 [Ficus carica]
MGSWPTVKGGQYRVRSGYRVVMDYRLLASTTTSNPDIKWWRLLWAMSEIGPAICGHVETMAKQLLEEDLAFFPLDGLETRE